MEPHRRDSGPPLPPGPGRALPLLLGFALTGFVITGFMTLGALAEMVRPGGMRDPANLLLVCLVVFPLAVLFAHALDRPGFPTLPDGVTLRPSRSSTVLFALLFGLAAAMPLAELDNLLQGVFPMSESERRMMVELLRFDGWTSHFLKTAAIVGVTPIGEEMIFRGVVLRWLRRSYGRAAGIGVSSLLFAAGHLSLRAFVPILLLGLFLAWVTDRSRSILPAITTHTIYNAAPFLLPPGAFEIPGWTPTPTGEIAHLPAPLVVGSGAACLVLVYAVWWSTLKRD